MMRELGPDAVRAAFLLGGVGTGNVSVGARGELRDWELANRPGKGRRNPFSFFAIHAAPHGAPSVTRVLEAGLRPPHDADQGYVPGELAGLPRLTGSRMRGRYPLLDIEFADDLLPVQVSLAAFTPFVPLDAADSGMPCAVLRYTVRNPGDAALRVAVAGTLGNPVATAHRADLYGNHPVERRQSNGARDEGGLRGLWLTAETDATDLLHGQVALATADPGAAVMPAWRGGDWSDGAQEFWDAFSATGRLPADRGDAAETPDGTERPLVGSVVIEHEIPAGGAHEFEFLLGWCFPNRPRGWGGDIIRDDPLLQQVVRNDYASRYDDAWQVVADLNRRLPALESATRMFADALYDSDLPEAVRDAVGSNLATLRSTTCFVLEGGVFAAWEGSLDLIGSCEGTCTHVWNYAQSAAWLFPSLERSARRTEFLLETREDGRQNFRTNRVFGSPEWDHPPAADGQLGSILRVYREWLLSGDDDFLREVWPGVRRAMGFVFTEWDPDGDLVLGGEQHTTYDIEFHGENPLTNTLLFAALRAGSRLAAHLGDDRLAAQWLDAARRGAETMDALLFDGEYYRQYLRDPDEWPHQYGAGVLSDQVFGQFLAHTLGLGHVLPPEHIRSAVGAVFRHNFRTRTGDVASVQRGFAVADEPGLVLCSWPKGGRPRYPFPYSDEVWTGVEYQVAAHLVYEGFADEGLTIVEAARSRYDGIARNPWSEIEFGNHYARSLSSWALLLAWSGQSYDPVQRQLRFSPARPGPLRVLFSTGTAWGRADIADDAVTLRIDGGVLDVRSVRVRERVLVADPESTEVVMRFSATAIPQPTTKEKP